MENKTFSKGIDPLTKEATGLLLCTTMKDGEIIFHIGMGNGVVKSMTEKEYDEYLKNGQIR